MTEKGLMGLVSFRVQGQLVGIDILLVREISCQIACTPVQLSPAYVCGLANLRGQIIIVLDLAKRLGLPQRPQPGAHHFVVLKTTTELGPIRSRAGRDDLITCADHTALRVDGLEDLLEVPVARLQPPPNPSASTARFLAGVVALDQELMLVLDAQRVLDGT